MVNHDTVELHWILGVIRRRFWIVILLMILTLVGTFFYLAIEKPVYETTVVFYIQPNQDSGTNNYNMIMAGEQLALTYSEVLKGPSVLQSVVQKLVLKETPESLTKKITVVPVKDTQLINVTVEADSPEQAALLANTLATTFVDQVQTLQGQRFTESLRLISEKSAVEDATILDVQSKIDLLGAENANRDIELSQLELSLTEVRSDYRATQQKVQALELVLAQIPDSVKIVENAQGSPVYASQAIATVMVAQPPAAEGTDFSISGSIDQLALTYTQMVTAAPVMDATIKELGLVMTPDQLASLLSAKAIPGTPIIEIMVNSQTQKLELVDAVAKNFIVHAQAMITAPFSNRLAATQEQRDALAATVLKTQGEIMQKMAEKVQADTDLVRLNNNLANHISKSRTLMASYDQLWTTSSNATDTVVIAEKAMLPKMPIDHRLIYYLIAAALSSMVGLVLAFLVEQLDDHIRTKQDLTETLGLTTLGTIGKLPILSHELVMESDPGSSVAEDFRVLGANIRLSGLYTPMHKLLVTSPKASDGKSMIAANLAVAMAQTGLRIALVDADLRVPRMEDIFHCGFKLGLTDALLAGNLDASLQSAKTGGLSILTSGHIPPDPTRVLNSPQLAKLINELAEKVDLVIIDSPAILAVADTSVLATLVDGVLMVVRSGYTSGQDAKEALARLHHSNAQLIGAVLNGSAMHSTRYGYRRKSRGLGGRQLVSKLRIFFAQLVKNGLQPRGNQPADLYKGK